jgi:hypothetical protein
MHAPVSFFQTIISMFDYPNISHGYQAYEYYVALKLHFSEWPYDWFHFRGRTHVSPNSFRQRKDSYWFERLSHLHSPFQRILAHCAAKESNLIWIRDIVLDLDLYLDWQARQDTLSRVFTKEIEALKKIFSENFLYTHGMHPYLVREYLGGRISLETLTIISDLTDCVSYWGSQVEDDPLFEMVIMRIMKYSPFLDYDQEMFEKILREKLEQK